RPDELLFGLVVLIGDAGGRTGGQRIDVTVALVVTGSRETLLEVRDVAGHLLLADVADRTGRLRELDLIAGGSACLRIGVDIREEIAVPAVGEAREHDAAVRRAVRRGLPQVVVGEL